MTGGPAIGVLDYGSGNLHSVRQALARLGAATVVSSNWAVLDSCDGLVLPGVGAFAACMAGLEAVSSGGVTHRVGLTRWARDKRPLLGVCVGHQVLFEAGDEHGVVTGGLGLLPGVVRRLDAVRLPHMGWDTVTPWVGSRMFAGINDQRFYFVHSYAVPQTSAAGVTWCEYEGGRFVAAVEDDAIWATQFHPEKSGGPGAALLAHWIERVEAARATGYGGAP